MEFIDVMNKFKRLYDKCCDGSNCDRKCPFYREDEDYNGDLVDFCDKIDYFLEKPKIFEELVIEWDKENPKITNIQKVTELIKANFDCVNNDIFVGNTGIVMSPEFADKEYVPLKKEN